MPAIQPARLKHQTAQLSEVFEQPDLFLRNIHNLLRLYADRTHRTGQAGEPPPILESYRVPQPVLREIILELRPHVLSNPQAALVLCKFLWAEPVLECRLLSSALLGQIPPIHPQLVLEPIQEWLETQPEDRVLKALLDQGFVRIRLEQPEFLKGVIQEWLLHEKTFFIRCGLWALLFTAIDPSFHNLPEIFHLLTPFIRSVSKELRPDILNILQELAHYAPQETAFLLRKNISRPDSSDTAWITRQVIHEFPMPIQESLRNALRST